jgi:hypothetical protein
VIVRNLAAVVVLIVATSSTAAAHEGWGIVVDSRGRVYMTDIPANTIWRISPDGRVEAIGRFIHSHALSLGLDGAVYGTKVSLTQPVRGVWRFDAGGRFSEIIPPTRGFPLDLQSFLLAPDGSVYSASIYQHPEPAGGREIYLLHWSPTGVVDTVAGGHVGHADGQGRAARFKSIDGMAWLPDGSIVLGDGARLRRVSIDGRVESLGPPLTIPRWDEDLLGVAVGPDSAIYAADFAGRVVQRVDGDRVDTLYRASTYWAPAGVAATASGFYVLEHPRAPLGILGDIGVGPYLRVRRISADGSAVTLTMIWGRYSLQFALAAMLIAGGVLLMWRRKRA